MKLTNQIVIEKAKGLGFDLVGFAKADLLENETGKLAEWIENGYQSGMSYMERNLGKRKDVGLILDDAKSVISLAINYYKDEKHSEDNSFGKVSRYAWGKDYHLVIWDKLYRFVEELKKIDPSIEAISYVDTGPVMDKVWALKSGLGWMGKHSNVITKELGSWIFIASVITNKDFDYGLPMEDFCGTCRACIDACPTNAIVDEYVVDASRCISYLTIENKGDIPKEFERKFDSWLFGCDTCQDVCPWNKKFSVTTLAKEFASTENKELNLREIGNYSPEYFKEKFAESPMMRSKLKGLQRNALFLSGGINEKV